MAGKAENTQLRRLRSRYRLVITNDDTYEEVGSFRLSRVSVYIALCTIFILLVGITIALIFFTPIKYYIPGSNNVSQLREYREMKIKVDSLEKTMNYQTQYIENIKRILNGDKVIPLDTMQIDLPKEEISE